MEHTDALFLESGSGWLGKKAREYRLPLLASLLFGLLAYGFNLTNKLINHDEAASLFAKGGTMVLGRWGLDILERIFPNVSMPWLYGLTTLVLMAVSVCVIVRIFHIRSQLLQVLLAGCIMAFPSLTSTMAYMFTCAPYSVSFLLTVTAVLLMEHPARGSVLPALACMVFSLSIYQSYAAVAAGLLILILIRQLLLGEDVKKIFRLGVQYLLFLAVSMGGYYLATQVFLRLFGSGFSGYASDSMSLSLTDIPSKILLAYGSFFRFFREGYQGLIPTALSRGMHRVMLAAMAGLLVFWCLVKRQRELPRLLLLAALLLILPLAIGCMYLFTTEDSVHTLVLYGFVTLYVLVVILGDVCMELVPRKKTASLYRRIALEAATLAMAVIIASNVYIANMVSLNLHLRYENAFAFYTSLIADLKMQPEFSENTKLAVIGSYQSPSFYYEKLQDATVLTGTAGFFPDNYSKVQFMDYYIGFPIAFVSDEEAAAIAAAEEYAAMPRYPYYGSMKFIGDTFVVKLS